MPIRTGFAPGNRVPIGNYWVSSSCSKSSNSFDIIIRQCTIYCLFFLLFLFSCWRIKSSLSPASLSKRIHPRALTSKAIRKETPWERDKDRYRKEQQRHRAFSFHSFDGILWFVFETTMTKKRNAGGNFGSEIPDRGRRPLTAGGKRLPVLFRIALFSLLLLVAATTCHVSRATVDAFCRDGQLQLVRERPSPSTRSSVHSSSALGLFRPDWMRRAGRIEEKRKERRDMYESLRKRQDKLDMPRTLLPTGKPNNEEDATPQRYRVVSSNNSNITSCDDDDDDGGLAIYGFVPENDMEANDESNVLDWLNHGEIVTAVRRKKVTDTNVDPPRMAVMAVAAIYNVQHKIRTDILWIEHDKGGWSPSIVDGVTRLVPIDGNRPDRGQQ